MADIRTICKVLFISDISCLYFASLADRMLIKGLHEKNVDITVITPEPTAETLDLGKAGIKIIYLPLRKGSFIQTIKSLRKILLEASFNIIHITCSRAAVIGLIASRGLNVRIVGYFGSMSIHWHDPTAWFAFLNSRIDRIICPSDAVAMHLEKQLKVNRRKKVVRIYRGYDTSWFDNITPVTRESLGVASGDFIICSVGNLRKVKGIKYLIKAIEHLPDYLPLRILLVGSGTNSNGVRRLIKKSGRAYRFILQGYVPLSPAFMASCNLYVQPSLSEGLGRAITEAMCLARPVIVTDGGGPKELITNGINGFVVKSGSHEAIGEAIRRCYENRESLPLVGLKAKETIMNRFNHRQTVQSTYDLYMELLDGNDYTS